MTPPPSRKSAPGPWLPWTIVHRDTRQPVLPMDCADDGKPENEALLVFRTEAAAELGCIHQKNWGVDAVPILLESVIVAEACGKTLPTEDPLAAAVRGKMYEAQGIVRIAGRIGAPPRKLPRAGAGKGKVKRGK